MIPGVPRVCLGCGTRTHNGSRCEACSTKRKAHVEASRAPKPREYHAAHSRIRRVRGPASGYVCVCGCGQMAAEWALIHNGEANRPLWSDSPWDYEPRCKSSHSHYDARTGGNPPGVG